MKQRTVVPKLQCAVHDVASESYLPGTASLGHFPLAGLGLAVSPEVTACKCHM